jgi:predicted nucleotidyltransferase
MRKTELFDQSSIAPILEELQRKLQSLYGDYLRTIILYGSYARGDFDSDSDIDIMALLDLDTGEQEKFRKALAEVVTDLSLKYDILVSVIESNLHDFDKRALYVPFYKTVHQEGIKLYGH